MKSEELKQLRLSLGLTQEEFGEKIGLTKSGISNMENGTRNISVRTENIIKLVFGIDSNIRRKNHFIKIISYVKHNLDKHDLFDLIMKPKDEENLYLYWKGTNDLFATVYVSAVEKIIQDGES